MNKSSLQKVEEETRIEDRKVMTNPRECPSLERKKNSNVSIMAESDMKIVIFGKEGRIGKIR